MAHFSIAAAFVASLELLVDLGDPVPALHLVRLGSLLQPGGELVEHAGQEDVEEEEEANHQERDEKQHSEVVALHGRQGNVGEICRCQRGEHA